MGPAGREETVATCSSPVAPVIIAPVLITVVRSPVLGPTQKSFFTFSLVLTRGFKADFQTFVEHSVHVGTLQVLQSDSKPRVCQVNRQHFSINLQREK